MGAGQRWLGQLCHVLGELSRIAEELNRMNEVNEVTTSPHVSLFPVFVVLPREIALALTRDSGFCHVYSCLVDKSDRA